MSGPTLVCLRTPESGVAELVVTIKGRPHVLPLSFEQTRLLAFQSTDALTKWPVVEKPFE